MEKPTAGAINGDGADLDRATAFFVGLGLEVEGRMLMEGEFVDTVTGIRDSRSQIVVLRLPGEARVWSCRVDERPARLESDNVGREELEYVHHEL